MAYRSDEEQKAYCREYNKIWYQRHKERLHQKRKQHDADLRVWLEQYKSQLKCMDCGISHPAVLQFHHRDRSEKSFNIADVTNRASSIRQIVSEMEKCDVVCVNCHAKRHWQERHGSPSGTKSR